MMADTTLSDGVTLSDGTSALASVTLPGGITPLEASKLDAGAGDAEGNSRDVSDADAVANHGDGMSPRGKIAKMIRTKPSMRGSLSSQAGADFVGGISRTAPSPSASVDLADLRPVRGRVGVHPAHIH